MIILSLRVYLMTSLILGIFGSGLCQSNSTRKILDRRPNLENTILGRNRNNSRCPMITSCKEPCTIVKDRFDCDFCKCGPPCGEEVVCNGKKCAIELVPVRNHMCQRCVCESGNDETPDPSLFDFGKK